MKRLGIWICVLLCICMGQSVAKIPDYIPKQGLIGYWPFNGNAQDESGNGIALKLLKQVILLYL